MLEERINEFTSTTQYNSKFNTQKKNLLQRLRKDYLYDLHAISSDSYQDIDIHFNDEDITLKHRCIINATCPLLLINNLNINDSRCDEIEKITIESFPEIIEDHQRQFLTCIYRQQGENDKNVPTDIDIDINLDSLLIDGSYSDITFKIQDCEFKCHKCILSSRCEYFARMFSGRWMENTQEIVELKDLSPITFRYILSYIYSNKIEVSRDVDITEVLYIADMYGINGIKAAVSFHLKANYCYFFIAPYDISIYGAVKSLEISKIFSLNELSTECYIWFVKNYVKIFANRNFAKVSEDAKKDILIKIKEDVSHLTILHHLKDCSKLKACLPTVKWAHAMRKLIEELEEYCLEFVSCNFERVISQPAFQYCLFNKKDINQTLMLQEHFIAAVTKYISKENCIDIFESTKKIREMAEKYGNQYKDHFDIMETVENCLKFVTELQSVTIRFISRNIFHLQKMKKWKSLKKDVKEQLKSLSGFISIADQKGEK